MECCRMALLDTAPRAGCLCELTCRALQAISLRDLKRVAVLGAGAFGQVLLVKANGQYYALKCLNKEQIVKMGLQASTAVSSRLCS